MTNTATKRDAAATAPEAAIANHAVWPGMQLAQQPFDYCLCRATANSCRALREPAANPRPVQGNRERAVSNAAHRSGTRHLGSSDTPACVYRKLNPIVLVMRSAEDG